MIFLSYPAPREELLGSGVVLKSAQAAVSSQHRAENWINSLSLFLFAFLLNSWTAKSTQRMEANLGFNPLLSHYEVKQQSLEQAEISTESKPGCLGFTHIYNFKIFFNIFCCCSCIKQVKQTFGTEMFINPEITCGSMKKENLRQEGNVLK